jgi:hypothetical protein
VLARDGDVVGVAVGADPAETRGVVGEGELDPVDVAGDDDVIGVGVGEGGESLSWGWRVFFTHGEEAPRIRRRHGGQRGRVARRRDIAVRIVAAGAVGIVNFPTGRRGRKVCRTDEVMMVLLPNRLQIPHSMYHGMGLFSLSGKD